MPAKYFTCPNGNKILINECLKECPYSSRCMFLPTLRAVAQSLERNLVQPTVTELLSGTLETYLKKTTDYAIDPQKQIYALHGSAVHTIHENYSVGNMIMEERLYDEITSGKFDLYGQILDNSDGVLGDFKVTSSYKLMKALGIYKVDVPTGEVFKSGIKKGQEKTVKALRHDGVKYLLDWAIQLNYYRILLEKQGFNVNKMVIQAICRDTGLRISTERGINQSVYLLNINKISDTWLTRYMKYKANKLQQALDKKELPRSCTPKETWQDRKCQDYCVVAENCPYGQKANRQELDVA